MARTAGSWVGVVGTRSSSRSARRPSGARAPLESTIRRPLLILVLTTPRRELWRPRSARFAPILPDRPRQPGPRRRAVRLTERATPARATAKPEVTRPVGAVAGACGLRFADRRWTPVRRAPRPGPPLPT